MSAIQEVLSRVRISDVWRALGGGELRYGRGRAWWRDGDGFNVSLNDSRGLWHDFATSEAGGLLDLVARVRGGTRQEALRWLANLNGVALDDKPPCPLAAREYAEAERMTRDALYFADAARLMAEEALEVLSATDRGRGVPTALIAALRESPKAEYCAWLTHQPEWAAALVRSGRARAKRLQMALARYLMAEARDAA